jgi:hypothetical protein
LEAELPQWQLGFVVLGEKQITGNPICQGLFM